MIQNAIAERYARTIFKASLRDNIIPEVSRDMEKISQVLKSDSQAITLLNDPLINSAKKLNTVLQVFSDLSPLTINFLQLMGRKNRIGLIYAVTEEFSTLKRQQDKKVKGIIYSAIPLTDDDIRKISTKFSTDSSLHYEFETVVQKDLIGGFLIRIGDRVIDWSIRNKLNTLKERLSA
jgi:F-type H+-transporting ATPase subunit delta